MLREATDRGAGPALTESDAPIECRMRLGLNLGYWGTDPQQSIDSLALAQEADRLGFAVVWAAEAYGSDAASVLGYLAARTSRIDIGSAVFQIPGRSAALTAMTAATLDALSGGRFRLGLGVSGPQVSEGWHGVRFDQPLARTREYLEVVRLALSGQPVSYEGKHVVLPLPDGPGKALKLTTGPARSGLPVYLAAVGPRNVELAGEVADGWLAIFFAPEDSADLMARLDAGLAKAGRTRAGFDVAPTVPLAVGPDPVVAADAVRGYVALYVGGMGSREQNFYYASACRMGYQADADVIQDRYLARDRAGAAAAVPYSLIDATSLLGDRERLADRLLAFAEAGVTTLNVSCPPAPIDVRLHALRTAAEALDLSGVSA
jgi:F420-dependent oxidoreductase-like protein